MEPFSKILRINSSQIFGNMNSRIKIGKWVESSKIQNFIIALIIINSITIGLETSDYLMKNFGNVLLFIDKIILVVFVIEISLKIYAFDFRFFKSGWNVFDFIIVAAALLPTSGALSVLRTLRIFRSLRLIKAVPKLRFIVEALLKSVPSIGWIFALLLVVFYVFAVIGTNLFGKEFPHFFGTIGASMYSLFQVMTLESWSMGISRPVMEKFSLAYLYFIPFILVATYTTLNIFIAIVVNTMSEIQEEESKRNVEQIGEILHSENADIINELKKIKNQINSLEEKLSRK